MKGHCFGYAVAEGESIDRAVMSLGFRSCGALGIRLSKYEHNGQEPRTSTSSVFLKLNEFEVLESYHSLYSIHLIHSTPKTILLLLVPYFTFEP